ncbi:MAG TPA: hypothetical protein VFD30_01020 [Terriglobia bacterium]|nr:hypothetical protein [Terriglobia bacterium]
MREVIPLVLTLILFCNPILEAKVGISLSGGSSEQDTKKPTLQERILEVQSGTMIEVKLINKHKLRGRLGEVMDDGFALQTAQGNKIETQRLAFTDVKSFKQVQGGTGEKVSKGLIYGLAGAGALLVTLIIVAAAASDH